MALSVSWEYKMMTTGVAQRQAQNSQYDSEPIESDAHLLTEEGHSENVHDSELRNTVDEAIEGENEAVTSPVHHHTDAIAKAFGTRPHRETVEVEDDLSGSSELQDAIVQATTDVASEEVHETTLPDFSTPVHEPDLNDYAAIESAIVENIPMEDLAPDVEVAQSEDEIVPEVICASMPEALAALSEPSPDKDIEVNITDMEQVSQDASSEHMPYMQAETQASGLKFANITAGENLEYVEPESQLAKQDLFDVESLETPAPTQVHALRKLAGLAPQDDAQDRTEQALLGGKKKTSENLVSRIFNACMSKFEQKKQAVEAAAEIGIGESAKNVQNQPSDAPVREEVSLFAGPNGQVYAEAWAAQCVSGAPAGKSWSTPAFAFSIAWFAYRKLYKAAMLALLTFAVATMYMPVLGLAVLAGVMICCGIYGKSLYVSHADTSIRSTLKTAKDADSYIKTLVRTGGVSWLMGIMTATLLIGLSLIGGLSLTV